MVPASSIPGSLSQKECWLRGARPCCLAAGYLCGNMPGERREGKGPGLAHLILASVGRKPGAEGSPGFPLGQRWARFISTQSLLCTTESKLPLRGRKHQESGERHSTQGTAPPACPGRGQSRSPWRQVPRRRHGAAWRWPWLTSVPCCSAVGPCWLAAAGVGTECGVLADMAMSFAAGGKCLRAVSFVVKN